MDYSALYALKVYQQQFDGNLKQTWQKIIKTAGRHKMKIKNSWATNQCKITVTERQSDRVSDRQLAQQGTVLVKSLFPWQVIISVLEVTPSVIWN